MGKKLEHSLTAQQNLFIVASVLGQLLLILYSYSRKIWRGIKFGGLAVGVETAKLKSTNIISYVTCNDVIHTVVLLAPSSAPLGELYL